MRRQKISLALNLLIIFLEMIGFVFAFSNHGWSALIYYTELSNILLFVAAMFYVCYTVWDLQGQKIKMPRYVPLLKYAATLSVAITFIVVITVLSWATKYSLWTLLTQQSMLFHHTLCPILAILSFLFFEKYHFKKSDALIAMSFTLLYAVVTIFFNLIGELVGPYPFLMVYAQPWWASLLWCIVILGGAYALARLLRWAQKKLTMPAN